MVEAISTFKNDAVPYHRLLHGPEKDIMRQIDIMEAEGLTPVEGFVQKVKYDRQRWNLHEWIHRLPNEAAKDHVQYFIDKRNDGYLWYMDHLHKERWIETKHLKSEAKYLEIK